MIVVFSIFFAPIFIHNMLDGFGNDSSVMQAQGRLQATTKTPVKRKGGRSKEKNMSIGIPQLVIENSISPR